MDSNMKDGEALTVTSENGEEVQVYYLSVPETSGESQVLDLANILANEGIQIVEAPGNDETLNKELQSAATTTIVTSDGFVVNAGQVVQSGSTDQSTTQSAHALLKLSESLSGAQVEEIQVSDLLAAQRRTEEHIEIDQQPTDSNVTYILDNNGTMIPYGQYSASANQPLKCELCQKEFQSQAKLSSHQRSAHPYGMPWECPECGRRFSKKIGLKVHLRAHTDLKQHKCTHCERIFSYKNALARHMRLHTKEKPYKCSICGEGFSQHWAMRRHRASHKPASMYQCEVCAKMFKQKQTLLIHARVHTGHKPYSCEICRKAFTLKSSLNQHLRIHTGERPKVCPICYKAFRQTSTLNSHMKLHTHVKPHKCRYCKMRFETQEEVTSHERIHVENKSWSCDDCGMRFRNQSLLSRHIRKHTNERPFQCKICGKSFSQSGSLQSHMRTHTKEKPYQCRLCPKTYTTSGTLLLHIRRAHGLEAKKVKDVFPSFNFLEDQKVFTIRSQVPLTREGVAKLLPKQGTDTDDTITETETNVSNIAKPVEEMLDTTKTKLEDVDTTGASEEVGKVLTQRINPDLKHPIVECPDQPQEVAMDGVTTVECQPVVVETADHSADTTIIVSDAMDLVDVKSGEAGDGIEYSTVQELMSKRQIKPGSLTLMNIAGISRYKIIDVENEKENSLSAQARQEAALGLAELSLVGGIVVSEKRAGAAARTIAREVGDGETDDPSVTKIVLSKEGGVMNSQDPHQCPECGRIFGRKSIMTEHRRIHTDEKPYVCDFCSVRFRQSAQLSSHIRNRHTKEKKYQCSFCHNYFLSRNITIRHINFHHKLKVRLCESINPSWTVDEAVWSDESFQIKTEEPRPPPKHHSAKDQGNPDVPALVSQVEKQNVSVGDAVNSLICALQPTSQGTTEEPMECILGNDGQVSTGTFSVTVPKLPDHTVKDHSELKGEELEDDKDTCLTTEVDADVGAELTVQRDIFSSDISLNHEQTVNISLNDSHMEDTVMDESSPNESTTSEVGSKLKNDLDMSNSRLVCETCAMQFRGISSLRHHLKKVHNTTLAQSDVSFVYEDEEDSEKGLGISYPLQAEMKEPGIFVEKEAKVGHEKVSSQTKVEKKLSQSKEGSVSAGKSNQNCRICSRRCSSRHDLEEHMKGHGIEEVEMAGMHRCDVCGVVLKNTQQITKHILKCHGVQNVYSCSICQKEFYQESSVLRHMKFFHKWEMKIRGESNIPVILKPAPGCMQSPGSTLSSSSSHGSIKYRLSQHILPKSDLKVSSRQENDMTFVSLEVGDLENLHLYRKDGKEVQFEVVSSSKKAKTLRIKGLVENSQKETDNGRVANTDPCEMSQSDKSITYHDDDQVFLVPNSADSDVVTLQLKSSLEFEANPSTDQQVDKDSVETSNGLQNIIGINMEPTTSDSLELDSCDHPPPYEPPHDSESDRTEKDQGQSSTQDSSFLSLQVQAGDEGVSKGSGSLRLDLCFGESNSGQAADGRGPEASVETANLNSHCNNQEMLVSLEMEVANCDAKMVDNSNLTGSIMVMSVDPSLNEMEIMHFKGDINHTTTDNLKNHVPLDSIATTKEDNSISDLTISKCGDEAEDVENVTSKTKTKTGKKTNKPKQEPQGGRKTVEIPTEFPSASSELKQQTEQDSVVVAVSNKMETTHSSNNVAESQTAGNKIESKSQNVKNPKRQVKKSLSPAKRQNIKQENHDQKQQTSANSSVSSRKKSQAIQEPQHLQKTNISSSQNNSDNVETPKGQKKKSATSETMPSSKQTPRPSKSKDSSSKLNAIEVNTTPRLSSRGRVIKKKRFADED